MIRQAAAIAVAVCAIQASLHAQSTVRTVNATSADVYKSPSNGSPIIGRVPQGTVLTVTRELGSWVKVSWPAAPDGVGYVHIMMASLGPSTATESNVASASTSSRPMPQSTSQSTSRQGTSGADRVASAAPAAVRPVYVTPSTHLIGLGVEAGGPSFGFGATARAWKHDRLGAQLEISRYSISSAGRQVNSLQLDPSLLYSLPDRVTDYVWLRPYLGSGVSLNHQTLSGAAADQLSRSESEIGAQVFGGGELTFASVPRVALSMTLGYHWPSTSFGATVGGLRLAVAGHWYVK